MVVVKYSSGEYIFFLPYSVFRFLHENLMGSLRHKGSIRDDVFYLLEDENRKFGKKMCMKTDSATDEQKSSN